MEEESFLLTFFEEFYAELVRQKRRAHASQQRPDVSQPESGDAVGALVESIAHTLKTLLEKQHFHVLHHGGDYALTLYREVQYILVALADEFMLNMNWAGRTLWEARILEQRIFNSHIAGEAIFERIETLIAQRDQDRNDVAKAYLLALGLGLRGKYRDDDAQLEGYKKRLFMFIHHHHSRLRESDFVLFPATYESTLEDGIVRQLPNPRVWHVILFLAMLGFLLISYSFWYSSTREINTVATQILKVSGVDKK